MILKDNFEASVYMLKKEEGGRKKPILNGYIQPLLTKTCTIDSYFNFGNDKTMLLGGDHANLNLFLKKPMVIFPGDRFTSNYNFSKFKQLYFFLLIKLKLEKLFH
jgi:elongation factor Tu